MSVIKPAVLLYNTVLNNIAAVHVTQNSTVDDASVYAGNLALHVQDDSSSVLQRRAALASLIGLPIQWLEQVHGNTVHIALNRPSLQSPTPIADAAVTAHSGIALAVMTADCLPVVFVAYNAEGARAIAVAHAGWRGLQAGILNRTVSVLRQTVPQATIAAHLAPCIGVAQFEVGKEVKEAFVYQNNQYANAFTVKSVDKYLCDLNYLARQVLMTEGLSAAHISGGGFCTVSDPRLASYRRQPITGRFATVVSML